MISEVNQSYNIVRQWDVEGAAPYKLVILFGKNLDY